MKKYLICLMAVAALLAGNVDAEESSADSESILSIYDGNELLAFIRSDLAAEQSIALGYVTGVADTVMMLDAALFEQFGSSPLCYMNGVTVGQFKDLTENYLEANPEQRHMPAAPLVMAAISEGFACEPETTESDE